MTPANGTEPVPLAEGQSRSWQMVTAQPGRRQEMQAVRFQCCAGQRKGMSMKIAKWLKAGVCMVSLAGLVGCESMGDHKGAIIGGVGGAAVGATAGALIGGKDNRGTGAVIGGVVGAAGGAVAGDQLYDKDKRQEKEDEGSK